MKTIVHISADFPDPLVPNKTKGVQSLIETATNFRHVVYSLNRVSWRTGIAARRFGDGHRAIAYGAPPYGVRFSHHLARVAEFILTDLDKRGIVPDLIHAHKFTIEGLVTQRVAEGAGCGYIASIWGDTDRRIFEAKPGLRATFRTIASNAACLLPAAPWTGDYFAAALQLDPGRFEVLPIITKADAIFPPTLCDSPRLISVFAFDSWKRKGVPVMAKAVAEARKSIPGLTLDIYGRGSPKSLIDMTAQISEAGVEDCVSLSPALDHGEVQAAMNGYAGFVLPSRPETYGMVFVEAVLAGVPILWSQLEAVDGLFDPADVGYRCNPSSPDDVAAGMLHLIEKQAEFKRRIGLLQAEGAFEAVRREAIGARYRQILAQVAGATAQAASAA
jgi:glycogen synthase